MKFRSHRFRFDASLGRVAYASSSRILAKSVHLHRRSRVRRPSSSISLFLSRYGIVESDLEMTVSLISLSRLDKRRPFRAHSFSLRGLRCKWRDQDLESETKISPRDLFEIERVASFRDKEIMGATKARFFPTHTTYLFRTFHRKYIAFSLS